MTDTDMPILPQRRVGTTTLTVSALGFGGAPLGNLYEAIDEATAYGTLDAVRRAGITYFDTAPYYGFGLSERRIGDYLRATCQDGVTLSTKVGRLLVPATGTAAGAAQKRHGFRSPMPFEPRYDYTYDGVMRSYEDSLQRLGLSRIDMLFVHDIGKLTHGDRHTDTFRALTTGGFRALEQLRTAGDIRAFGLGVNEWEICLEAMDHVDLDCCLLAGRYTLLEQTALHKFMPRCAQRSVSVILGGIYNSGILATGVLHADGVPHYNYRSAPDEIVNRVRHIESICARHAVPLSAAALQFALAHPGVASVIPGVCTPEQVRHALAMYETLIPADLWSELREARLIEPTAPTPEPSSACEAG